MTIVSSFSQVLALLLIRWNNESIIRKSCQTSCSIAAGLHDFVPLATIPSLSLTNVKTGPEVFHDAIFLLHDTAGVMVWIWTHEHAALSDSHNTHYFLWLDPSVILIMSFLPARTSLQCRKEPTTTVLQLAALVGTWGHKACQWRTAVGQPESTSRLTCTHV